MTYVYFKDLTRKTASDKILRDKAFCIAQNPEHDGYQRGLDPMVYNFVDKESSGGTVKNEIMSNMCLDLAEELHKPIITKFKKQKVY